MKYLLPMSVALVLVIGGTIRPANAEEPKSPFASTTIDIGMVVSDLDAAVKFYNEALGFREASGFSVPADFGRDLGVTDQPLKIRVVTLGAGPTATKLKLMQLAGAARSDSQAALHSQLGVRYLTLFVADAGAAGERLDKFGVKPLGKGWVPLALAGLPRKLEVAFVRDPDGNLVELVAPARSS